MHKSELIPTVLSYLPPKQSVQVEIEDAPEAVENFPAPQLWHTVSTEAPITPEYLPATQSTQGGGCSCSSQVFASSTVGGIRGSSPACGRIFSGTAIDTSSRCRGSRASQKFASKYLPDPQLVQTFAVVAPLAVEHFPALLLMQDAAVVAPVLVRYLPAPQLVQTFAVVAPVAVEYFPAPQLLQVPDALAPVVVENFPAPQLVQTLAVVAPTVPENLPCAQLIQVPTIVAPVPIKKKSAPQSVQIASCTENPVPKKPHLHQNISHFHNQCKSPNRYFSRLSGIFSSHTL